MAHQIYSGIVGFGKIERVFGQNYGGMVKRILRKYGYLPNKQKKATDTVLEQAALICDDLAVD